MYTMPSLRQNILVSISLLILFLGGSLFGLAYFTDLYAGAFILFVIGTIIILFIKLHLPLKKIIEEMKALLTGRHYRKIMTNKRNEIGVLAYFFNEVTTNLEKISGQMKEHTRIKKEVNTAQKIQKDILPEKAPKVPGLDIIAKTRPASEIGGDTFNFYPLENKTVMYVGDSTGHGIPAGIVMVMVDVLLSTFINMFPTAKEVMINLNKFLKPNLQATMFMTMIYMEWDHKNEMTWVGAGHEYIVHVDTVNDKVTSIPSGGIAVGMLPDNTALVKEQKLVLNENDFLIVFTDGITEAKNVTGEIYGIKRLETVLKNSVTKESTAEDIFNKIAIDVGRFMEGAYQLDDMTLFVVKKTSSEKTGEDQTTSWSNG